MIDELWNEVVARMMPTFTHFSDEEGAPLAKQIGKFLEYPYAAVDWGKYPEHIRFDDSSEIIPLLEKLLQRHFDDTVYVYAPDNYVGFLKVPLRKFLAGRYKFIEPMWLWNPTEGYIIEERSIGYSTVGLVPKMKDLFAQIELKKDSFPDGSFRFRYFFRNIVSDFGIDLIDEQDANKILASFRNIAPRTYWGRLDWEKIETKTSIGANQDLIVSKLTQLLGKLSDFIVYIEWCDESLPLAKTDLKKLLTNYRQATALSLETILFNLEAGYVIEINASHNITIGALPRSNS